jgi:hypothetical protein
MKQPTMAIKSVVKVIDCNTQIFQKMKAVIALMVVTRVHTVDRYRLTRSVHFPGNRRQMIYVVKVSDKKEIHLKASPGI